VVDAGRPGYRALGVTAGGPADARARAAANRLLGRNARATTLELTGSGGRWLLSGSGQIALTGADFNWRLNGRLLENYQTLYVEGDGLLTCLPARSGLRAYLAVNGDWHLPRALGSAEAGLPDIPAVVAGWSVVVRWSVEAAFRTDLDTGSRIPALPCTLRVIPGPEWEWLTSAQQNQLLGATYRVGRASNRQGIRLEPTNTSQYDLPSMISSPVLPGTIQLTPAGPILLGPAAQTIGGYPRVLLVADQRALGKAFQVGLEGEIRLEL
jgi:antagonist of KipI